MRDRAAGGIGREPVATGFVVLRDHIDIGGIARDGLPVQLLPVAEIEVKAEIARPALHEIIPADSVYRVHGAAWTGESQVTKVELSTDGGTLLQSTYLGGAESDAAAAIAVAPRGVYVAGQSGSLTFPVLAAFLVLKAVLDGAEGKNPLGSVIAAMFLLSVSGTLRMMQGFNSGSEFATTDLLASLWNYLAGTILPLTAG